MPPPTPSSAKGIFARSSDLRTLLKLLPFLTLRIFTRISSSPPNSPNPRIADMSVDSVLPAQRRLCKTISLRDAKKTTAKTKTIFGLHPKGAFAHVLALSSHPPFFLTANGPRRQSAWKGHKSCLRRNDDDTSPWETDQCLLVLTSL